MKYFSFEKFGRTKHTSRINDASSKITIMQGKNGWISQLSIKLMPKEGIEKILKQQKCDSWYSVKPGKSSAICESSCGQEDIEEQNWKL